MSTKREKRVKTTDDFYPTNTDGKVAVFLHKDGKSKWRVAVWGEDDFGLERTIIEQSEAFAEFNNIGDGITVAELLKRGYKGA